MRQGAKPLTRYSDWRRTLGAIAPVSSSSFRALSAFAEANAEILDLVADLSRASGVRVAATLPTMFSLGKKALWATTKSKR
jgi:hypothetical protein